MATAKLGLDCKLYISDEDFSGSSATWPSPTTICKDVTVTMSRGEADVTTRAAQGWRQNIATLRECSIETTVLFDATDDVFEILQDAFMSNLSTATSSAASMFVWCYVEDCIYGKFVVTDFSRSEPLEDGVTYNVTLKLYEKKTNPTPPTPPTSGGGGGGGIT